MTKKLRATGGAAVSALLVLAPIAAHAQPTEETSEQRSLASGLQLSLKVEPGVAMAMTSPQSRDTDLGGGAAVKLLFGLSRYLSVGPSATFTTLPSADSMTGSGRAWTFGGGGRLMRPHDAPGLGLSPWLDADVLYVKTGDLSRPGFAVAAGASLPLGERRQFWVGPFVRYSHIIQGEREGFDNRDAKVLSFGVGLEVTSGLARKRARVAGEGFDEETVAVVEPVVEPAPSDRDGDGVIDADDLCPDVAGVAATSGCPPYEKVVVRRDKLELKEKIAFGWNSAELDAESHVALDEVARALTDNPEFRVQVDGHASSDGGDAHNQTLSEQRSSAVVEYLVAKGVARDRLISKGFSSSVPTETNRTVAGRESNRRVEFIVEFILVEEGNTP